MDAFGIGSFLGGLFGGGKQNIDYSADINNWEYWAERYGKKVGSDMYHDFLNGNAFLRYDQNGVPKSQSGGLTGAVAGVSETLQGAGLPLPLLAIGGGLLWYLTKSKSKKSYRRW